MGAAIDNKDAMAFAAHFNDDGVFRMANQPMVRGRNSIAQYCAAFFQLIPSSQHNLIAVHESVTEEGVVTWQGWVTYRRKDGSTVSVPFCNVLRKEEGRIAEYHMYIDTSALFAAHTNETQQAEQWGD